MVWSPDSARPRKILSHAAPVAAVRSLTMRGSHQSADRTERCSCGTYYGRENSEIETSKLALTRLACQSSASLLIATDIGIVIRWDLVLQTSA